MRWIFRFLRRFAAFLAAVGGAGAAAGWLLGEDAALREYLLQNQGTTIVLITLSAIMYAMYVWLDEPPEE